MVDIVEEAVTITTQKTVADRMWRVNVNNLGIALIDIMTVGLDRIDVVIQW